MIQAYSTKKKKLDMHWKLSTVEMNEELNLVDPATEIVMGAGSISSTHLYNIFKVSLAVFIPLAHI